MFFRDERGATICNLIDGKSHVVEQELFTSNIQNLIGDEKFRSEICAYLGVEENEIIKGEQTEREA